MFIEVYTESDRDALIESGYRLIREVPLESAVKYVFANSKELKFSNTKVKGHVTNTLTF